MTHAAPRRISTGATILALAGILAGPIVARGGGGLEAQAPDPGQVSQPTHEVSEFRGQKVAMPDGVELSVDVYRPEAPGRYPVVLSITPYDNNGMRERARWFAQRGYAFVGADSRGRFDSEGDWAPSDARHKTDGHALVAWAAAQPWSTGKVGMVGGSYVGWTQWWTASTAPPALAAIIPFVAPPDGFENIPYQNGVLSGWLPDWAAGMSGRVAQRVGEGPYNGWTARRRAGDMEHTPYIELNEMRGMLDGAWFRDWYANNLSTDPFWRAISYQGPEGWGRITVPSMNVTGWFDVDHPGSPMNYVGMKQHGATPESRRPTLIIGPWIHGVNQRVVGGVDYGPDATIDLDGYQLRWFDRWLKGIDNGVEDDPPVYVFVMGENAWHAEADWPLPQTQWTKYWLSSGGSANSLKGDGVLTTRPPARDGVDSYVYDPLNPTRDAFIDLPDHNGHIDGAVDTRLSALGDEVLVYTTPPLTEPVEVTGPIEMKLYASTSARDTDWMVRLVDVHPDGYAALLTEGVLRARSRNPDDEGRYMSHALSTIRPDSVYEYTVRFWKGTGNLFRPGHRIRVEISSSWYPFWLPNLNTGADNLALVRAEDAVVATQRVHHGPRHPSHIVLPVIPARAGRAATN